MQYLLYFLIGGGLICLVAYLSTKANPIVAIIVANIPVIFLLNLFLMYRNGGIDNSIAYAKASLAFLPIFAIFVITVIFFLPKLKIYQMVLISLPFYSLPLFWKIRDRLRRSPLNMAEDMKADHEKTMPENEGSSGSANEVIP